MHDVIVVGGSYAGLSATIMLARARRDVLVVDAGERRNRFVIRSHGFIGHDGDEAAAIVTNARSQIEKYRTVSWAKDFAEHARRVDGGFALTLRSGKEVAARRIVLALGVVDELPKVIGLRERWGKTIFHCPFCHGYELDQGPIAVLATMPSSMHQGLMLPDWGATTFFTNGAFAPSAEERAQLAKRGTTLVEERVESASGGDSEIVLHLANGEEHAFRGLFLAPKSRIASALPVDLGCELEQGPMGPFIKTDAMKATTVPGVFACGDAAIAAGSVPLAIGDGARAGASAYGSLLMQAVGHFSPAPAAPAISATRT